MKQIFFLMLSGLFYTQLVLAEETLTIPSAEAHASSSTQQWLELQRSGNAASSQAQPLSGEVMDKVHQRYIKSFEKPIPEFYEHEMPATR
jgi:hypothetical protein